MYFFFLELVVSEAMFACFLNRREKFVLRLIVGLLCAFAIQYGYNWFVESLFTESTILKLTQYLVLIATTTVVIYMAFDCSIIKALVCSTGGYAIRNFVYCISYLLYSRFNFDLRAVTEIAYLNRFLESLFFLACYVPLFFWIRFNMKWRYAAVVNVQSVVFSVLIVFTTVIISAYIPFESEATDYAFIYSAICSILVVSIQLGLFEKSALKQEIETIKQLDHAKWEQYKLFSETMEQISIKSHDLKQQINLLMSGNPEARNELLDDTLKTVDIYDSMTRTGNDTLDIVLTEKHLICERNKIKCSCIADGSALNFMSPMDIAALFGNAMDNAIEGVRNCAEEKRFINVNVSKQGDMLIIHIENYFDQPLTFHDGLPQTTKTNKANHGFGMKSIRMIVEKYNGTFLIQSDDNLFAISILFTNPQNN